METEITDCSPIEILNDVTGVLGVRAREKNLALSLDVREPLPVTLRTDPVRLRQVITHLVGNAIKFTPSGGVRISMSLSKSADRTRLRFDIIDTGIGMTPEQIGEIFEPLTRSDGSLTRRFGGSGPGLSISRQIVRDLGGKLTVKSVAGQGSVFSFDVRVDVPDAGRKLPESTAETCERPGSNPFSQILKTGLEAMLSARRQNRDTEFCQACEELKESATAFGKARLAASLNALTEVVRHGGTSGSDLSLGRFVEVAREELAARDRKLTPARPGTATSSTVSVTRMVIRSRLPMDEPEFREIVSEFVPVLEQKIDAMKRLDAAGDRDELARIAHWLKGAGGTVGFDEFYQPSVDLEQALRSGQTVVVTRKIAEIASLSQAIELPDCEPV